MSKLPVKCPSCEQHLHVSQLSCLTCDTLISGSYPLPKLMQLPQEDQDFILQFVLHSGSLKKMALQMEISYPTMRNKLDDIIEKLQPKL
ncbi:DUF2089 family protein [Cellulophaga sp. Hel_I_12]|uniref:DUF2089 family protein n=1 Tax=Cellulophaga sp. Hel_I_12 TaxID=1249972 RepID=UPI000645CAC8|nr:DUF2089 family protein [Cellulophaga sp. Hel_I_12]